MKEFRAKKRVTCVLRVANIILLLHLPRLALAARIQVVEAARPAVVAGAEPSRDFLMALLADCAAALGAMFSNEAYESAVFLVGTIRRCEASYGDRSYVEGEEIRASHD